MDPWQVELVSDTANVVLGWLLGVASALGVEKWKGWKRRKAVKAAIRVEFAETAHRLLALYHKLTERTGGLDRQVLEWVLANARRYDGPNPKDGIIRGIEGILRSTDAEIAVFAAELKRRAEPQFWPTEEAPYASSSIPELHDADPDYARRVLDVLAHLRMLNEARENSLYYLRLTFAPGLAEGNFDRAIANLEGAYVQAANRARIIINKVVELEAAK